MVKMIKTDETWYIVRNTRGVTGFVGMGKGLFRFQTKRSSPWALVRLLKLTLR